MSISWSWDPAKNRANQRKHGLSFETAQEVFRDPLALSRLEGTSDEERWQTIGIVGLTTVLVVHTTPIEGADGEEAGRIISARKATPHERRAYQGGDF